MRQASVHQDSYKAVGQNRHQGKHFRSLRYMYNIVTLSRLRARARRVSDSSLLRSLLCLAASIPRHGFSLNTWLAPAVADQENVFRVDLAVVVH